VHPIRLVVAAIVVSSVVAPVAGATARDDPVDSTGRAAPDVERRQDCSFPVTRTDATGTEVTLETEPTRVVTLAPSAAQTLWEIGTRERVVGLTKYASNLEGASSRTNVSTSGAIVSVEAVVGLEPDLVLAPNATATETVERLRSAGVAVYHFREARSIADIERKVRTTGWLVGVCGDAAAVVGRMDRELAVVREATDGRDRPDVLYSFYGYTAGEGTFVDTIIEAAGGDNVADDNVTGYKPVNAEFVVEADPEWIVRNSDTPAVPETEAYNSTTAVREGQVVVVPIEYLNRPAPRVVRAVAQLARAFHPEAYAAANATPTASPTPAATPTSTPTPTATPSPTSSPVRAGATGTTSTEAPGFDLAAGTLALAVATVVARLARPRR
jgi:iron complex transport system substrate-binding protein